MKPTEQKQDLNMINANIILLFFAKSSHLKKLEEKVNYNISCHWCKKV